MTRKVVHITGLMPPSSGPVKTRCRRLVPISSTMHIPQPPSTYRWCKVCQSVMARKKRLGLWPWSKPKK